MSTTNVGAAKKRCRDGFAFVRRDRRDDAVDGRADDRVVEGEAPPDRGRRSRPRAARGLWQVALAAAWSAARRRL